MDQDLKHAANRGRKDSTEVISRDWWRVRAAIPPALCVGRGAGRQLVFLLHTFLHQLHLRSGTRGLSSPSGSDLMSSELQADSVMRIRLGGQRST